jgi:hypothetical protein
MISSVGTIAVMNFVDLQRQCHEVGHDHFWHFRSVLCLGTWYHSCISLSGTFIAVIIGWPQLVVPVVNPAAVWRLQEREVCRASGVWQRPLFNDTVSSLSYCYVVCVAIDGVWIGEWISWPLIHTLGTTSNYSATANLHNSQITTAPAKSFPAVPWKRILTVEILQIPIFTASLTELNSQLSLSLAYNISTRTI